MDDPDSASTGRLAKRNSDSGFDNESLSDNSSSSSKSDYCTTTWCLFEGNARGEPSIQLSQTHRCSLSLYSISGRCIETLSPHTFLYLSTCVRVLDLSKNKIQTLPETLGELQNLQELNLSCNELMILPDSCRKLQKLKVLNLSENKLLHPPTCLELGMEQIAHLDLSKNFISNFPNPPKCSPLLQCLKLHYNLFNLLPLWLFGKECRSIEELDISFNFCFDDLALQKQLPLLKHHRTSALKSLKKLLIYNTGSNPNLLNSALSSFESLQNVHMGNLPGEENTLNYFAELDFRLFHNPSTIIELHLPKVGLALLPKDVDRFTSLQILDASYNNLDWLPDEIVLLKSLTELILSDCNLCHLPENFNQLKSLKKLVLNENKLTDVHSSLSGLPNLEYLDLYNNLLEDLPVSPDCLPSILMVDFDFNVFNVEVALDLKVNGELLFDIYCRHRERLRSTIGVNQTRHNEIKVALNYTPSSASLNSLNRLKNYHSGSDSDLSQIDNISYQSYCDRCNENLEEENWDEDSSNDIDQLDVESINRYQLKLGVHTFGWRPVVKIGGQCRVPINQIANGHLFIPQQSNPKTTARKFQKHVEDFPVEEEQFEDAHVDSFADLEQGDSLGAELTKCHIFVRNPDGVRSKTYCKFHSYHEECWHDGLWFTVGTSVSLGLPEAPEGEDI